MISYLRSEFRISFAMLACMRFFSVLICLNCLFCACAQAQTETEFNRSKYINSLKEERQVKDVEMQTDAQSPIPEDEKKTFKSLNYYKPKVKFLKQASFVRFAQPEHFHMKTTTERLPEYSLYGKVTFRHMGRRITLNVYKNIELSKKQGFENYLFIPFTDKTNGKDTYGGGRFLDVTETGADKLTIDFNKAYNPYCAYNHKYSCPIPPPENHLKICIKAGEKKLHK